VVDGFCLEPARGPEEEEGWVGVFEEYREGVCETVETKERRTSLWLTAPAPAAPLLSSIFVLLVLVFLSSIGLTSLCNSDKPIEITAIFDASVVSLTRVGFVRVDEPTKGVLERGREDGSGSAGDVGISTGLTLMSSTWWVGERGGSALPPPRIEFFRVGWGWGCPPKMLLFLRGGSG
jgi:hypothetical protein